MAINWKLKIKQKDSKGDADRGEEKKGKRWNFPYLGLGMFFLVLLLLLIIFDIQIYKDNFKTASLSDMTNGKYREDVKYVDTCVNLFHDLVMDTLYRDGYYFSSSNLQEEEGSGTVYNQEQGSEIHTDSSMYDSREVYDRVQKLRDSRGLYTYVNQDYKDSLSLFARGSSSGVSYYLIPGDFELTFYNNGNAYSGGESSSYCKKASNDYGEDAGSRLAMVSYRNGSQNNLMVIGQTANIHSYSKNYIGSFAKYGILRGGRLYHLNYRSELISISERGSFELTELTKYGVNRNRDGKVDVGADFLYTISDDAGSSKAFIDVSVDSGKVGIQALKKQEEEGNTLEFKEVWNSIFSLAEYVPEKTPLLFLSDIEDSGSVLQGNQAYVERYRELYGTESVEVFNSSYEQLICSKRYRNKKEAYSSVRHSSHKVLQLFAQKKKIVALFADQKFHFQYKESPLYSFELAALVLRYSLMLMPILFLFGLCFLVTGIHKRQQSDKFVYTLALGFMSVELRGCLLLFVCCSLIYCYTTIYSAGFYRYLIPFFICLLLIFFCATFYWWIKSPKEVFSNSWITRIADRRAKERAKRRKYYHAQGMGFFLNSQSTRFAYAELICCFLILVALLCKYIIAPLTLNIPLFGSQIKTSLWSVMVLFFAVIMLMVFISYLRFLSVFIQGLNGISQQLKLMGEGDFETVVPLPETFYGFQAEEQFEAIKNGVLNAVEGEMRSERMKIDLVTNVSHDIKTPLTSIINYVDLLADSKSLPAVEADYVRVLQKKSYRLRSMIQDLFDLSKVTSGNLLVEPVELNFTRLIQQTMADMQESIEASNLQFKCNLLEQVHIVADGNRLYRVLQNLINNVINYSMERSRVYLNLDVIEDHAVFSIKNISRDELNFTKEEVLERFFRGDKSRSTEGSGLGVAIANSFVEVCGGEFDISIDADLFCATIRFPVVMPLDKLTD